MARGAVYALQKDPRYAQNPLAAPWVALMRHIIAVLLQNEAGALNRVAGMFSTRGYNIESRTGVTVLVAPGPEVTTQTPTRPLARA